VRIEKPDRLGLVEVTLLDRLGAGTLVHPDPAQGHCKARPLECEGAVVELQVVSGELRVQHVEGLSGAQAVIGSVEPISLLLVEAGAEGIGDEDHAATVSVASATLRLVLKKYLCSGKSRANKRP